MSGDTIRFYNGHGSSGGQPILNVGQRDCITPMVPLSAEAKPDKVPAIAT
jgi:hypothetical protein